MQSKKCNKMSEVRGAIASGAWMSPVIDHALECEACSELWIAAWVMARAREEAGRPTPAIAAVIWWKARLDANRRHSLGVLAPIVVAQILTLVGAIVALIVTAANLVATANQSTRSSPVKALLAVAMVLFAILLSLSTQRICQYNRQRRSQR
jgi:hypothetical protein